jgi:hypothetical protein
LVKVKSAIKSNYFNEFANVKALQESPGKDPDQQALNNLSMQTGWKVLKEYIERISQELDDMTRTQMTQGVSFEEIGRSTIIKEITKDVLRKIINKVEDSRGGIETGGTA